MKKNKQIIIFLIIQLVLMQFDAFSQDPCKEIFNNFYNKVEQIQNHGGYAVVGIGVSSDLSIGRSKARLEGMSQFSNMLSSVITSQVSLLLSEHNNNNINIQDSEFKSLIKQYSMSTLYGISTIKYSYCQKKANKKNKNLTHILLMVMSPETILRNIEKSIHQIDNKYDTDLMDKFDKSPDKQKLLENIKKYTKYVGSK